MIEIVLGNIGSGKTATIVREMVLNKSDSIYYSNILTPKLNHNINITPSMIIKEIEVDGKKKTVLNVEFWQDAVLRAKKQGKSITVIIDEAHTLINSRRAMSKKSVVFNDFLALLRRVIGGASEGYGKLVLISQLERRLDIIAKEMATKVKFCIAHYVVTCKKCGAKYIENNETPEKVSYCHCGCCKLLRTAFIIEMFHFANIDLFSSFYYFEKKTFHAHYTVNDIEQYFTYYDTLQWDNLLSEL